MPVTVSPHPLFICISVDFAWVFFHAEQPFFQLLLSSSGGFIKNTGLAIGITLSGSGIGGSIISPFLTDFISTYGGAEVLFFFGILMIVIEVPVAYFMMIPNPEDIGYKPYGMTSDRASASPLKNLPFQDLKKTYLFLYLPNRHFLYLCCRLRKSRLFVCFVNRELRSVSGLCHYTVFLFLLTPAKNFPWMAL